MKYFVIFLFFIGFLPVFAEETESIVLTPYDIILSEDDFTAQGPNHNILILERGQSATINIVLENNDNESHQITLKNPKPSTSKLFDSFRFEPEQVTVLAHQKNSTKLYMTISEDTNTHSSFVTFLAQSNTFGMKGIGFVLVVDGEIDELVDKSLRSGFPGPAFPRIDIQISEDEAEKMIDNRYETPGYLPKNYQFRGMTDWGDSKQFVYSPSPVENSTEFTNFWKDGGMLISYYNYIDRPNVNNTKSLPVRIAQDEGQQIMINGLMGMTIEKQTRVVAYSDMEYDVPAEVDFFDDTKRASVSLKANMSLNDLLKIASSISIFVEDSTSDENAEKPNEHLLNLADIAPLKQFKSGIAIDEIQCKNDMHVLTERPNGKIACVYELTAEKLGWKIINSSIHDKSVFEVAKDDVLFDVDYSIKGGMVKDMTSDADANSLLIKIDSSAVGNLTIDIPRGLVDAKLDYCPPRKANSPDDLFFVLLDGEEIPYDEISTTSETRTLKIHFLEDTSIIEVIGTCFV